MSAVQTTSKAVIYPACTLSGYGHICSLGRAGIPVTALSPIDCPNFKSRYVGEQYVVPNPYEDHEQFIFWLIDYGRTQEHKPVLFMVEDIYAYIASLYQDQLRPYFLFSYIPLDRLDVFFNKKAMCREAAQAGLHLPMSLFSPVTDKVLADWSHFPVVIKPQVARFQFEGKQLKSINRFVEVFGAKALTAHTPSELTASVQRIRDEGLEYFVQEYIPGGSDDQYTVYFVADRDGTIPSYSSHYKVRQRPADFGTTAVSQSKSVPELRDYIERFCKTTGYSGPGAIEFKRSPVNGTWYFIELNARLDFSVSRSTFKGVNMPLQQYLFSTGQEMMRVRQRDGGRFWIDLPGDIEGLLWRRGQEQWRLSFWQILKPYLYGQEAVFNLRDPRPGLAQLRSALRWILRGKKETPLSSASDTRACSTPAQTCRVEPRGAEGRNIHSE